jgi:hypothetical protein
MKTCGLPSKVARRIWAISICPSSCGVMDRCDLIVTAVTMAMHFAIGLDKKLFYLIIFSIGTSSSFMAWAKFSSRPLIAVVIIRRFAE